MFFAFGGLVNRGGCGQGGVAQVLNRRGDAVWGDRVDQVGFFDLVSAHLKRAVLRQGDLDAVGAVRFWFAVELQCAVADRLDVGRIERHHQFFGHGGCDGRHVFVQGVHSVFYGWFVAMPES